MNRTPPREDTYMSEINVCCDKMRLAITSDDVPMIYVPKLREFGIRVLDGGTSYIELLYCPWSGDKLPASLRDHWFDELERRGIDPGTDEVPPEFLDHRWYSSGLNR